MKRMKRTLLFGILAVASAVTAQTPAIPKLYTYYMPATGGQWLWRTVNIDAPLALTVDSAGQAHLTVGAMQAPSLPVPKRDVFTNSSGVYVLSAVPNPTADVDVYWNGVLMAPGIDYTLAGATITFKEMADPSPTIQVRYAQ